MQTAPYTLHRFFRSLQSFSRDAIRFQYWLLSAEYHIYRFARALPRMSQRITNDAEISKERRKAQNRYNQRAHRLRTNRQRTNNTRKSHAFEITRWRLDDFCYTQKKITDHRLSCAKLAAPTSRLTDEATEVDALPRGHDHADLTPPAMIFPLSTDHLLHLIQYNVFRALSAL